MSESLKALSAVTGREADALVALIEARVPVASMSVMHLDRETTLGEVLARMEAHQGGAEQVLLRPVYASKKQAKRVSTKAARPLSATMESAARQALSAAQLLDDPLAVRVIACRSDLMGGATSADRDRGNPDEVHAWSATAPDRPWRIERLSARVSEPGEGLTVQLAERVADLVDRVQLALGYPVRIEWCVQEGERPVVASVRPLVLSPRYLPGSWSRLTLVEADEGNVAPLAIDALDRGLRVQSTLPDVELTVRREYARPYRRRQHDNAVLGRREPKALTSATTEVARVGKLGAKLLQDAIPFERSQAYRRSNLETPRLAALDDTALLNTLRERHRLVAEAFLLLDRCRELTRKALEALEAVIGRLPDESYPALAAPRAVRDRRRVLEKLERLRKRLDKASGGDWDGHIPSSLRKRFDETKLDLAQIRPLGIDVIPLAYGASDQTLIAALEQIEESGHVRRERAREDAAALALRSARSRSMGLARVGLAQTMLILLGRIARVKGGVSEGVAASLLQLRRAACAVGARLVERAVIDEPEDALYLSLSELEEAVGGEPGAYASRVRFRREDDERWANYEAPRRIG